MSSLFVVVCKALFSFAIFRVTNYSGRVILNVAINNTDEQWNTTVLLTSMHPGRIDVGEIKPKPTVQRSAKGAICIDECSPDGKYIQLANTSAIRDVDLTGWCLLRSVNNAPEISFTIPNNFKLDKTKTVKIYARNQDDERSSSDLVSSTLDTWGVGHTVVTRLLNNNHEEKAVHIERIVM